MSEPAVQDAVEPADKVGTPRLAPGGADVDGGPLERIRSAVRARNEGGFTFIEVLVVIIIIGILALIAIATFFNQQEKARRSRAISAVKNAETYAVAIAAEEEPFSSDPADYRRVAGDAPYSWQPGSIISTDPEVISVHGPDPDAEDLWVSFAAAGGDTCFYSRLGPGGSERVRHRTGIDPDGGVECRADEFADGEPVPGGGDLNSW